MLFSLMVFLVLTGCKKEQEPIPVNVPDLIIGTNAVYAQTTTADGFTFFSVGNHSLEWEAFLYGIDAKGDTIAAMVFDCQAPDMVQKLRDNNTFSNLVEYKFQVSVFKKVDHLFFVRSHDISKAVLIIKGK